MWKVYRDRCGGSMKSKLFTFCSAASLLLCLSTCYLWCRGHFAKSGAVLLTRAWSELPGGGGRARSLDVLTAGGGLLISYTRSDEVPARGRPVERYRARWRLLPSNDYPKPRRPGIAAVFGFFA